MQKISSACCVFTVKYMLRFIYVYANNNRNIEQKKKNTIYFFDKIKMLKDLLKSCCFNKYF